MTIAVRSLHVYPLKGARGIALGHAEVLATGIRHDRAFMLVDEAGEFVSQRKHPRLALVDVALDTAALTLSIGRASIRIPFVAPGIAEEAGRQVARIWDDAVEAAIVAGDGSRFLSDHLGARCTLLFMPESTIRAVDPRYARPGDRVRFADGFPLLVANEASLAALGDHLRERGEAPVPMDRFRPNIVIGGDLPAYAEDLAARMTIGALSLRTPKPCARCRVTTVDQATGTFSKEPLRTLARYRVPKDDGKVLFAMNAIPDLAEHGSRTIAVGDSVVVG